MSYLINSEQSETSILSCIFQENSLIHDVLSRISDSDFHDFRHRFIYQTLKKLILDEKRDVDVIVLNHIFQGKENITSDYLIEVFNTAPSTALLPEYIRQVKETATRANLLSLFHRYNSELQNKGDNFNALLNKLDNDFRQVTTSFCSNIIQSSIEPSTYIDETLKLYEQYKDNPEVCRGIKTGFEELDKVLKGLKTMNIVMATTGTGKSVLAPNWASFIALTLGLPILYINFEMQKEDLIRRIISSLSEVPSDQILSGYYNNPGEWKKVQDIANLIKETNTLFLTDNEPKNINDTISLIYHYKHKHDIKVVFIDYIGEIQDDDLALKERNEYITYGRYTQMLKETCAKLDIRCVLLAQLSRAGETDPKRSNIQGSWKILQKADTAMTLFFNKDDEEDHKKKNKKKKGFWLRIEKQRHGLCPYDIELFFRKEIHRFKEVHRE